MLAIYLYSMIHIYIKPQIKQVRLNKDASERRDEGRIADRNFPDLIASCLLQIVCSYIAGCLSVI